MNLKELKAKRQELLASATRIEEYAADMGQDLTEDQTARLSAIADEVYDIDSDIVKAEKLEALRAKAAAPQGQRAARIEVGASEEDKILASPTAGFKNRPDFFHAVLRQSITGRADKRLSALTVKGAVGSDEHGEYDNSHVGFLVPEAFRNELLQVQAEVDPTASLTMRFPMEAPSVNIPARVDKNHSTSVTGGIRVYRRDETAAGTSSRMEMERIKIEATSLMGLAYATEELLADSPLSVAALINNAFNQEIQSRIFEEKISGTGVGEYQGVLNSPALISVTRTTGSDIKGADLINMRERAWRYGGNYVWLANNDTYSALVDAHITGTNDDTFLFRPGNGIDVPDTILGRPVYFTEYCPALGSAGDIMLVNWREYLEGFLGGTDFAESMHVRFENHERAFKVVTRNGGAGWWRSALTPKNGANTLSPFITVAA